MSSYYNLIECGGIFFIYLLLLLLLLLLQGIQVFGGRALNYHKISNFLSN